MALVRSASRTRFSEIDDLVLPLASHLIRPDPVAVLNEQVVIACVVGEDGSLYVCTTAQVTPAECLKIAALEFSMLFFLLDLCR